MHYGNARAIVRGSAGGGTGGGVAPRSALTLDPRRTKGGGVDPGVSRGSRFSSFKRSAASSPTPPDSLDHLDLQGVYVIANRMGAPPLGDEEDDEEDGGGMSGETEGVMEELKQEEEEGVLSLIVDRSLLHKDFIVTRFTLALLYYKKVMVSSLKTIPLLLLVLSLLL